MKIFVEVESITGGKYINLSARHEKKRTLNMTWIKSEGRFAEGYSLGWIRKKAPHLEYEFYQAAQSVEGLAKGDAVTTT